MKLLIIGATRGIGNNVLTQAFVQGHEITVLVRDVSRLDIQHENLKINEGDTLDGKAVERVVEGQDAVCITIGIRPTLKKVTVFSERTKNVIAAMTSSQCRTLICVTGIGAGDSKNHGGVLYDKIFNPLFLKTIYEDKDRQEELIRKSNLEWIIVRPAFLTNGPLTKKYRVVTDLKDVVAGKISRADVAHLILQKLNAKKYLRKTPLLTY